MNELKNNCGLAEQYEKARRKLSEIDTQVILVEPVLRLAGYNVNNPFVVKRASRNGHSKKIGDKWTGEFDVEIYDEDKLKIAIEVKSLSGFYFDIASIEDSKNSLGKMTNNPKGYWDQKTGDDIGQLRAYCINYSHFIEGKTLPVITNGRHWILFGKNFIDNPDQAISLNNIHAYGDINDSDFYDKIVKQLEKAYF